MREAKRRSSWAQPDERYENALLGLVDVALEPKAGNEFLERFAPFASRIARLGVHVSLAQLALKLTAPGVPDVYQGCELWDFSLVDPDNRRPVDFALRAALLEAVDDGLARDPERAFAEWLRRWHDGRVKLAVTRTLLALRSREAKVFGEGEYVACDLTGPRADEIVAYLRRHERRVVLTVARRFRARSAVATGVNADSAAAGRGGAVDLHAALRARRRARSRGVPRNAADRGTALSDGHGKRESRPVASNAGHVVREPLLARSARAAVTAEIEPCVRRHDAARARTCSLRAARRAQPHREGTPVCRLPSRFVPDERDGRRGSRALPGGKSASVRRCPRRAEGAGRGVEPHDRRWRASSTPARDSVGAGSASRR